MTKVAHTLPILVALAVGAVAGAVAGSFAGRGARERADVALAPATADAATREDRAEAALRRLEDLERRVDALELRPSADRRETVDASRDLAGLDALDATSGDDDVARAIDLASPEFEERVALALDGIRERERAALVAEKERVRAEKLDRQLEELADHLQLARGQVDDLRELYHEREAFEAELTREWRDGADDEWLGRRKQEGASHFDTRLDEILSPVQREQFDALWARRAAKQGGK